MATQLFGDFEIAMLENVHYFAKVQKQTLKQCIIYDMNIVQSESTVHFTVPASRCWMARSPLGEKKENEEEGGEGRKTNTTLQERWEHHRKYRRCINDIGSEVALGKEELQN